jgi:hypothetical protein
MINSLIIRGREGEVQLGTSLDGNYSMKSNRKFIHVGGIPTQN